MTRRPSVARTACALLLLAAAACSGPQSPWETLPVATLDLKAEAMSKSVPLLGEFELRLDLWRKPELAVDFAPAVPDGFVGRVQLAPERELGSGRWTRATFTLRPTAGTGPQKIPPFVVKSKDGSATASTPELELEVTSTLAAAPAGGGDAVEPPSGLLEQPFRWLRWTLIGVGALLLAAGLAWWWRRPRAAVVHPTTVQVPPHVKALRELQRLRAAPRGDAIAIDAFYVAVSAVLRVYLEERFGLHAPERTTEEFLLEVEAGGPLSVAQCRELRRFLDQCDLVKFAGLRPDEGVHLATLAAAEGLVEQTRADRAPLEVSA